MKILPLNVMVLGPTGVGKSSLVNYLFDLKGNELLKTGAGTPVTPKGVFSLRSIEKNNLHITVLDSWGVENGKTENWNEIIFKEISSRKANPDKKIHSIIYCVRYGSMVQFEHDLLIRLSKEGYQVVVALTHADCGSVRNEFVKAWPDIFDLEKNEKCFSIVEICSVSKKKIGQKDASQLMGRDEIWKSLYTNYAVHRIEYELTQWKNLALKENAPCESFLNDVVRKLLEDAELFKQSIKPLIKVPNFEDKDFKRDLSLWEKIKEIFTSDIFESNNIDDAIKKWRLQNWVVWMYAEMSETLSKQLHKEPPVYFFKKLHNKECKEAYILQFLWSKNVIQGVSVDLYIKGLTKRESFKAKLEDFRKVFEKNDDESLKNDLENLESDMLLYFDDSSTPTCDDGFLLTSDYLYVSDGEKAKRYRLDDYYTKTKNSEKEFRIYAPSSFVDNVYDLSSEAAKLFASFFVALTNKVRKLCC